MCLVCDRYARSKSLLGISDETQFHVNQAAGAAVDAWSVAFQGALLPGPQLLITTDTVPGDTSSTVTLTVGAPSIISTIDTIGDQDFYKVTLEAGQDYEFGMYGFVGGPNLTPLSDAFIEIYDSAGNLIVSADGGADTPANQINSGFDVLLTYTPSVGGTYYVNARAFDQTGANNEANGPGDFVGDYELFVREALPGAYQPYYDVDSPLYAIDWGTQVDGTARNPDGNEGTRDTGNAQGTPDPNNPYAIAGKNIITIYFAKAGDVYTPEDPTNPGLPPAIVAVGAKDYEITAVMTSLHEFEKVADVIYVVTENRAEANFHYVTYTGTPGPGISLLGSMSPPQESDEGLAQFNSGDERWNESNLQQGGFSFVTLIHEFGHGHGLAHPHDTGGRSGVMRGVEGTINTPAGQVPDPTGVYPNYTLGDFDLNQAVFSMMSYQDGWQTSPYGNAPTNVGYGYLGGLMAFDIAAIQDKYGVNEDTNTGNDTYLMRDVNAAGTFYYSIWDAGGIDAIVYSGARVANIDLRAATLQYEYGGGGWVSFAHGIFGGFTIANGVTIENAFGGDGNDTLTGNGVANLLDGGDGADVMAGGDGNDTYRVNNALDAVVELEGGGDDIVLASASYALAVGASVETMSTSNQALTAAINLTGNEVGQSIFGNEGANVLLGGGGVDQLVGYGGNDILVGGAGADVLRGGLGNDVYGIDDQDLVFEGSGEGDDTISANVGSFFLNAGASIETLTTANQAGTNAQNLTGNELGNSLYGNEGANVLNGGGGVDRLTGYGGADIFLFNSAPGAGNADFVADFASGTDRIALDNAVFAGLAEGNVGAEAFVIGGAAADANDRIIYNSTTGQLFFDADGNGAGQAILFATLTGAPGLTASDFMVI